MDDITTAFQQRRLDLGMTQQDLADECTRRGAPVGDSQISKIERGKGKPLPPLRRALKLILGDDPVKLANQQPAEVAG